MKMAWLGIVCVGLMGCASDRSAPQKVATAQVVEAACGECMFGLAGIGCDLAVRIDGQAYFVDGASIDDYGDAHGADGFCKAIRQARVEGEVLDGRFQVSFFELLPQK